ncbi:MAG: hypothetical protein J0H68_04960 [Sphingobacteriia bacterium]|nr:hypothetical protein [Sphingobacteriia bacterium]
MPRVKKLNYQKLNAEDKKKYQFGALVATYMQQMTSEKGLDASTLFRLMKFKEELQHIPSYWDKDAVFMAGFDNVDRKNKNYGELFRNNPEDINNAKIALLNTLLSTIHPYLDHVEEGLEEKGILEKFKKHHAIRLFTEAQGTDYFLTPEYNQYASPLSSSDMFAITIIKYSIFFSMKAPSALTSGYIDYIAKPLLNLTGLSDDTKKVIGDFLDVPKYALKPLDIAANISLSTVSFVQAQVALANAVQYEHMPLLKASEKVKEITTTWLELREENKEEEKAKTRFNRFKKQKNIDNVDTNKFAEIESDHPTFQQANRDLLNKTYTKAFDRNFRTRLEAQRKEARKGHGRQNP